jgi:phosphatidate cytidylyltransferase
MPWLGALWSTAALPATQTHDGWPVVQFATLIWANDTMAFVGGKMMGRHKLAPTISPGKTWEGAVVGALSAGLAASMWWGAKGLILGLLAGALSTCGDLVESRVKRLAKVKDSGALLPGHGGVLDRFDGFLFAAPVHALLWCIFVAQT